MLNSMTAGSDLDNYLKLHQASKATTFAANPTRDYDFSAVDQLDSEPSKQLSFDDQEKTEDTTFTLGEVAPSTHQNSVTIREKPPRKELQAFCPVPLRRRDRPPSGSPKNTSKPKSKPTQKPAAQNNSKKRSKSPANGFAPVGKEPLKN